MGFGFGPGSGLTFPKNSGLIWIRTHRGTLLNVHPNFTFVTQSFFTNQSFQICANYEISRINFHDIIIDIIIDPTDNTDLK